MSAATNGEFVVDEHIAEDIIRQGGPNLEVGTRVAFHVVPKRDPKKAQAALDAFIGSFASDGTENLAVKAKEIARTAMLADHDRQSREFAEDYAKRTTP